MIFQEPMTSLNPVFTDRRPDRRGGAAAPRRCGREAARARALEMLRLVRLADPERRLDEYPHQLSGGMRQRVMIAMALACEPDLVIADEPTTALDVTIQAQILDLLADLRRRLGTAILLITHDLGVVAETCDDVAVMYAGRIVERAPAAELFAPAAASLHDRPARAARPDAAARRRRDGRCGRSPAWCRRRSTFPLAAGSIRGVPTPGSARRRRPTAPPPCPNSGRSSRATSSAATMRDDLGRPHAGRRRRRRT